MISRSNPGCLANKWTLSESENWSESPRRGSDALVRGNLMSHRKTGRWAYAPALPRSCPASSCLIGKPFGEPMPGLWRLVAGEAHVISEYRSVSLCSDSPEFVPGKLMTYQKPVSEHAPGLWRVLARVAHVWSFHRSVSPCPSSDPFVPAKLKSDRFIGQWARALALPR